MENKILATVGGTPITTNDVDEFLLGLGQKANSYNNPEGRAMILKQLIDSKLLLLDAKRNLLEGEADFRAQLAKLKDNLLANYAAEKAIANVKSVTEDDIVKFYNENQDKFSSGEVVNASHILVDSEEKALEIYEKITNGSTTFADAAKEYSSCPSKENGGSLGEFTRGQMVPEFDEAVFSMEVGEITKTPVKTQFGYHLIMLNSKNESTVAELSEVKENIRAYLENERQRQAYETKINQLKIMYPVDII
jgi:peptidyl-prolyl cis-trans isomerase C